MIAELRDVSKEYTVGSDRIEVLKNVNMTIGNDDFLVVMGPSGSGKSTLLHLLGCLEPPSDGEVRIRETPLSTLSDESLSRLRNSEIGFVFQAFHLIPRLTVLENVEIPLLYTRLSVRESRERAVRAIEAVGLGHRIRHAPAELSGGERQRVAIARALVNEPGLVLADEPTGNLDARNGREIMEILARLNAGGRAVVVVTHNPDVAAFARRQVYLENGSIAA